MGDSVRCTFCGGKYDIGLVKVIHRYADATLFLTPCCNKQADDREWKDRPDYRRIMNDGRLVLQPDGTLMEI